MSTQKNSRYKRRGLCSNSFRKNQEGNDCPCESITFERKKEDCKSDTKIGSNDQIHLGSQIQNDRNGGNVATVRDIGEKSIDLRERRNYRCSKCGKTINKQYTHEQHVSECYFGKKEGIDYVECKLCTFVGGHISRHVKSVHKVNLSDYNGKLIADNVHKNIKSNGDWIKRSKAKGEDLSLYKQSVSIAVRKAINSSESELNRRSKLMSKLNKRKDFRERASIVAKCTSKREDIISQRSEQLRLWREQNPIDFQEKCTQQMHKLRTSKPEKFTRDFLQQRFPDFNFIGNQKIWSDLITTTQSHSRQVDIVSFEKKIVVEIDGYLHFNNVLQWNNLDTIKTKDQELNDVLGVLGYKLIRISYDQWKNNGELYEHAQESLMKAIEDQTNNFILLGERYNLS